MKDTGERLIPKLHNKSIAYGEHLARYKSVCEIVKNKVVLDIACGTGYGTQMIADSAKHVYGVDVSGEAVEYAKVNYPHVKVTYKQGDARKIPLDDASVDVVVSLETIEHIPDPEEFVKEVKRVLKKGGQFVVSTPNDDEFTDGNIYHVHEFDFKELNRLMKKYFNNFEYFFQGSWFASGIFSKVKFEKEFSKNSIEVKKSFSQKFEKAIYYIAVASDSSLQQLSENLVIADIYSAKNEQENSARTEKHIMDLNKKVERSELQVKKLQAELSDIHQSRAWKLVTQVRTTMGKVPSSKNAK